MIRKIYSAFTGASGLVQVLLGLVLLVILAFTVTNLLSTRSEMPGEAGTLAQPTPTTVGPSDTGGDDTVYLPTIVKSQGTPDPDDDNVPAEWTTREEPLMGIKFKYPPEWYVPASEKDKLNTSVTVSSYDSDAMVKAGITHVGALTENDVKVDLYWSQGDADDPTVESFNSDWAQLRALSSNLALLSTNELQVGNHQLLLLVRRYTDPQGGGVAFRSYYISHAKRIFVISVTPAENIHLPTVEQLIATIEFTD